MAVRIIGPVVREFSDVRQLMRLAAGEHQDIGVSFRSFQTVGQQSRIILVDQNDHLSGHAILDVAKKFTNGINLRFVILSIRNN